ncbi:MAG: general stress protein CsbD [Caldithrix sp. RBG_13_44_9]|nr:MAG: general stress protein CsbD [Caldithrix sp. RBG_13_44_9]
MNRLSIMGNWNETAGKLKQKYANLTENDWLLKEGQEKELLGRHQKKLGKIKEEIRSLLTRI